MAVEREPAREEVGVRVQVLDLLVLRVANLNPLVLSPPFPLVNQTPHRTVHVGAPLT